MNKLFLNLIVIAIITIIVTGCDGQFPRSKTYLCVTDSDSINIEKLMRVSLSSNDDYLLVNNYAVTPDEEYLIINNGASGIWRVDRDGDNETLLSDTLWVRSTEISLSNDGSVLAFVARGDIYRVNVDGSNLTRLTDTPEHYEDCPGFYGEDNKLLFTCINNINQVQQYHTVSSMNFDGTGRENLVLENSRAAIRFSYPAYLAEASKVVYLVHGDDSGVDCVNLDDGSLTRFISGEIFDNRIHVSDDGSRFAVCFSAGSKVITSTGEILYEDSYGYSDESCSISPSGLKIAVSDNYNTEITNLDTNVKRSISGIKPFWRGNNLYFISYYYD